jgi:hypothetical protein
MRALDRITIVFAVTAICAAVACSDSAKPLGSGDKFVNDTAGQDAYSPPPPSSPSDAASDADAYAAAAAASACESCSCDPKVNYCFSGEALRMTFKDPIHVILAAGFGEPDGAAEAKAPPPPPCPVLTVGSTDDGCIPLPAACAATPTCACVLAALQPLYACYLDCSPTPGYLSVRCPNGAASVRDP